MNSGQPSNDISYNLLTVIVNRGNGSTVLEIAHRFGICDASCLLGKGTIKNHLLHMIEMDDVNKEIILIALPSTKENQFINQLNKKFHFERQNHGIAFTIPLSAILNSNVNWHNDNTSLSVKQEYTALLLIVNKGNAEKVVEISQNAGYYGGTIIKAHGSANKSNIIFDMLVEPEKEAVLMLTKSDRANHLSSMLNQQLQLSQANTGILVKIGIDKTIGLFQDKVIKEVADE